MDKNTQKVVQKIEKAKGEINFILTRLIADIEAIYHKPVNFAPTSIVEPSGELPPPF